MKYLIAALIGGVLFAVPAQVAGAASAPLIITIHGGGFKAGAPEDMMPIVKALRAQGAPVVSLRYRLGSPAVAVASARYQVLKLHHRLPHRRLFAWGGSAGGTIALRLAADGLVDRAVAASPVTDLTALVFGQQPSVFWPGTTSDNRVASPHCPHAPTLMLHAKDDTVIPISESRQYALRCHVKLIVRSSGNHTLANTADLAGMKFLTRG